MPDRLSDVELAEILDRVDPVAYTMSRPQQVAHTLRQGGAAKYNVGCRCEPCRERRKMRNGTKRKR